MSCPFIFFDRTTSAADADRTRGFYGDMFDWSITPENADGPQPRSLVVDQQPWGAIVTTPVSSPAWVPYVMVADLAAGTAKATSLGATVVSGPDDWNTGFAVTLTDPTGATFALWSPK